MRLCGLMMNPEADTYPIRLWRWAVRSAPDGDLTGMEPYDIECALRYRLLDGKLYSALVKAGFIDELEDGTRRIHDWHEYTGGAITKMSEAADRKKRYRAHRDGDCPQPCEFCQRGVPRTERRQPNEVETRPETVLRVSRGQTEDKPTQTRPVQSSQDKTSQDKTRDPGGKAAAEPRPAPRRTRTREVSPLEEQAANDAMGVFRKAWEVAHPDERWVAEAGVRSAVKGVVRELMAAGCLPEWPRICAQYMADRDPWVIRVSNRHGLAWLCANFGRYRGNGIPAINGARGSPVRDVRVGHVRVEAGQEHPEGEQIL